MKNGLLCCVIGGVVLFIFSHVFSYMAENPSLEKMPSGVNLEQMMPVDERQSCLATIARKE